MIEAIREIGEYSLQSQGKRLEDPITIIIEDPASNEKYKHVLTIILKKSNDGFIFEKINQEEYSPDRIAKYLYRQKSTRGTDYTPTARLTDKPENTLKSKFVNWFEDAINNKNLDLTVNEVAFLQATLNCLTQNYDKILSEFKEKKAKFSKKETGIITLKYSDTSEKYIGDIPVFEKIFVSYYFEKNWYSIAYQTTSKSDNQICSVCKKECPEVFGFVSTYTFYNVDKPGFISGGFDRELAWKNYPVCLTCALTLEEGKQFIEKNFDNFNFYGIKYCIIPKILQKNQNMKIFKLLSDFRKDLQGDLKIKREHENLLSSTDDEILDILSNQENSFNNNFLFYNVEKSAFRILLYMEDIVPSRLRAMFKAKRDVERKELYKKFDASGQPLRFTFGHIRQFFSNGIDQDQTKYFLEITNSIFTNKKINYAFLMHGISQTIQQAFTEGRKTNSLTFQGLQLLDYLNHLNLIDIDKRGTEMTGNQSMTVLDEITTPLDERIERIFNEFPDFFNEPAKKAIFLQGVLTEFLLYTQRKERNVDRGSEPFRKKLRGLKLDEQFIKGLFPDIQNKLEEYGKNYHSKLEEQIAKYTILAGNGWRLSKDEISFYYVIGMDLSYSVMITNGGK